MGVSRMLDWQQWKDANRYKIQHIVGYEERFVDEILSQIPDITPNDVVAQYPFKDSQGGNRYIDFMIINDKKGYKLPIELDGYAKINNKGYEVFNDFLERQNDLIQQFGIVLRYTNKKAFNQQQQVIREIRQALKMQASRQINSVSKQKQIQVLIQEYEAKIAEYEKNRITSHQNQVVEGTNELAQVRKGLDRFKHNQHTQLQNVQKQLSDIKNQHNKELISVKKQMHKHIYVGVGLIASMALGTLFYIQAQALPSDESAPLKSDNQVLVQDNNTIASDHYGAIQAVQAAQYIGENKVVCGKIAQYKEFSKGVYLNFDEPYPNATFTAVIWDNYSHVSQSLKNVENTTLCIQGTIDEYKGRPQMILSSLDQIV